MNKQFLAINYIILCNKFQIAANKDREINLEGKPNDAYYEVERREK